jgi:glycosyltransferase involved in cell wall biosynthesis
MTDPQKPRPELVVSVGMKDKFPPSMPLVTIAIPTFERRIGLLRAVEAARSQTYQNLEILISDNCSQAYDIHLELLEIVGADSRLKVIRQSRNIGATANFQFLCDWAQGAYFIWMADDDYCEPNYVETLIKTVMLDPSITLCASDVVVVDETDQIMSVERLEEIRANLPWEKVRRRFVRYPTSNIFFCVYGMFQTEALRNTMALPRAAWKEFYTNGEVPFLAKVAMQGRIVAVPNLLKYYRSHKDSFYVREVAKINFVDRFCLRTMIRKRLLEVILSSTLPASERLICIGIVLFDAVKAGIKAPLRSPYKAVRAVLHFLFKSQSVESRSSVSSKDQ